MPNICRVAGCGRPIKNKTHKLCRTHNDYRLAGKPVDVQIGLRNSHHGATCTELGCARPYFSKGLCKKCYNKLVSGPRRVRRFKNDPSVYSEYKARRLARHKERMLTDVEYAERRRATDRRYKRRVAAKKEEELLSILAEIKSRK